MKILIKPINDYEKLYSIISNGMIWSHRKNKFLKPSIGKSGYKHVVLYKNGNCKTIAIHILIAKHFINNPLNLPEVNHKDTNKLNNNINNLEWCTNQENSNHKVIINKNSRRKSKYYGVCFSKNTTGKKKWISYITMNNKQKNIYYSYSEIEAAKKYNNYVLKNNLNRPLNIFKE